MYTDLFIYLYKFTKQVIVQMIPSELLGAQYTVRPLRHVKGKATVEEVCVGGEKFNGSFFRLRRRKNIKTKHGKQNLAFAPSFLQAAAGFLIFLIFPLRFSLHFPWTSTLLDAQ